MTDIAADLREAASAVGYMRDFLHAPEPDDEAADTALMARLEALADAVEAKDPTAWGMEPANGEWMGDDPEPAKWSFPTATETEDA